MRLVQVITDYIQRSILTTQGDMVVRGVGVPERLAAGALNDVLKGQGAGAIPAYRTPSIADIPCEQVLFTGVAAGNLTTAALSFAPKLLYIIARDNLSANWNYSCSITTPTFMSTYVIFNDGLNQSFSWVRCLHVQRDISNYVRGEVSLWTSNGFTIDNGWTGAVTMDVQIVCFG